MENQGGRRKTEGGRGKLKPLVVAVMIATLAGCAAMKPEPMPEVSTPGGWRNAPAAQQAAQKAGGKENEAGWPDAGWWNRFGSPELVQLIESAEKHNHDLAAAGHRIAQARGNLKV